MSGLGYAGRPSQVTKWIQLRHRNQPSALTKAAEAGPTSVPVALPALPTCMHPLVAQPSRLSDKDQIQLAQLRKILALQALYTFTQSIAQMIRQRQPELLDS